MHCFSIPDEVGTRSAAGASESPLAGTVRIETPVAVRIVEGCHERWLARLVFDMPAGGNYDVVLGGWDADGYSFNGGASARGVAGGPTLRNAPVRLYRRWVGGSWRYVGAARTDGSGVWRKRVQVWRTGDWQVRHAGTSTLMPASSPVRRIRVR